MAEPSPPVESLDEFLRDIEERALTQTGVLLEREETSRWRHWGINE